MPGDVLVIERVVAGGAGLARAADGRIVFVDGALPGETVTARLVDERRDFARATVLDVLEPSADRVAPPCPHLAAGCGGCTWQHIAPTAQLALKVDIVRDALRRTAGLPEAAVRAAGAVAPWGYRTSLRLAITADGRLGLRRTASHDVVALDGCPVAHPALDALLGAIRAVGAGEVALRVSAATGEATALAIGAGGGRPARRGRRPTHTPAPRLVDVPGGVATGRDAHLTERVAGVGLRVGAASFFQSGPAAAELLVAEVAAAVGAQHGPFVDAYGGVGLFAATVAAPDHPVVLVESSPSACADARFNLRSRMDLGRVDVVEARVERWTPTPADVVVADPARAGLQRDGAAAVAGTNARRIVLVSCDPVSLARDATLLAGHGYLHGGSAVLDLFPHTAHVEVVTIFERG